MASEGASREAKIREVERAKIQAAKRRAEGTGYAATNAGTSSRGSRPIVTYTLTSNDHEVKIESDGSVDLRLRFRDES